MPEQVKFFEHANPPTIIVRPTPNNTPKGIYKCRLCPCIFLTEGDYNKHMATYTDYQEIHIKRFRKGATE